MKREKMAWMVSVGLVAILAFQLPGTLAQRDDDYSFVRTLIDIHRQVAANYVEPVDESKLREGAIGGMLEELDPFTMYVPPVRQEAFDQMLEGSFKGVGIQLNQEPNGGAIEVVTPIDNSPASKAGVLPGDQILKVNGENIEGMRLQDVVKKIAGKLGSAVTLTVKHTTGEERDLTMTREEIVMPTIKGYSRRPDNTWDYWISEDPKVAYIRVVQFTSETSDAMRAVLEKLLADGMKGLIMDLRYNPGGQLDQAIKVVDMFIDHGVIVSTKGRNRPEQVAKATSQGTLPYFPVICLVNEHSASAAEIVSGSLEDNKRALVVGERTYGKGSVQELIPLEQKSGELKLTVAYYYLPSGRLVHKKKDATDWGVKPQIPVSVTAEEQKRAYEYRLKQELAKAPMPKATTRAMTQPSTTQVVDTQLQRSVDVMLAWLVFGGGTEVATQFATTEPTTKAVASATSRPGAQPAKDAATLPVEQQKKMNDLAPVPATRPSTTRGVR
ncbi:MAG TPA: S41 family peptidase [Tepidisphaeraceae bacterium]|jgi:carboxyl-terminal processing protease